MIVLCYRAAAAAVLAASALAASLVVAPASQAGDSAAPTRVQRTSASTSAAKSVTATCPDGTDLIGTGGRVNGGDGEVVVTDIVPSSGLRKVKVTGAENGGYPGSWTVTAIAVCSSSASSLSRVSAGSEDNGTSADSKTAQIACPDGEVLLGMGYRLDGAGGEVFPSLLEPVQEPPVMAVVSAQEDLAYGQVWNLDVFGICGFVDGEVAVEFESGDLDSPSSKLISVSCPAGMYASSAGGNNGGQSSGVDDDLILERMTPDVDLGGATVRIAENLGVGTDWIGSVYAICIE